MKTRIQHPTPFGLLPFVFRSVAFGVFALASVFCLLASASQVRADGVIVTGVASGDAHSLYATSDGLLYAMGWNSEGQLGDGTSGYDISRNTPVKVDTASNVIAVAAGAHHSIYLTGDGSLYTMGDNFSGQLGSGTSGFKTSQSTPVKIASATNVVLVAAGNDHNLYVTGDGSLYAVGANHYGQFGDGHSSTIRSTPVKVPWVTNVIAIAAGDGHSLCVTSDGSLYAMGKNSYGQLGDGTKTSRSLPVKIASNVIAVAAGDTHSLYITSDGSLYATGSNSYGQLGDGTKTARSLPVKVASNVIAIAAGFGHSLYVTDDGSLYAMGANDRGQLGDGTTTTRSTPVKVGSASNVVAVAAGRWCSFYTTGDGSLYGMGANAGGELGDGTGTNQSTPKLILSSTASLAPAIIRQSRPATVIIGQTAIFTMAATGNPAPSYQWQSSTDGTSWTNMSGAIRDTLTITSVTAGMNGTRYRCVATNATGSAAGSAAILTVLHPAQALKIALEASSGTRTLVTVSGSVDLSFVGGVTINSPKWIEGADAGTTITGDITFASGANDTIIDGVNFTNGTFVIDGADNVDVYHCTFTDMPVSITGSSGSVAFSWSKFAATTAGAGSAMTITSSAADVFLARNLWDTGLRNDIPRATGARVLMFNNYITATGNTTATVAGEGAQILSLRNIYQDVNNPITKQSTGRVRTIDNFMFSTTGTTAAGEDEVFVPHYSHAMIAADNSADALANFITTSAGNTAGKDSPSPWSTYDSVYVSATVIGSGTTTAGLGVTVPVGGDFRLIAHMVNFSNRDSRQWYLDNFPLPGATGGTYLVTNANASTDAGAYSVAIKSSASQIVVSGAFTVTVGTPSAPVITEHPASQAITAGGSVIFGVTATGENLAYQWQKGGADISGATGASYTITNAQQSHAGSYTVRVSNPLGAVTSNAATLTINPSGGGGDNNGGNNSGDNNGGGSGGSEGGGGAPGLLWLCALAGLLALRAAKRR